MKTATIIMLSISIIFAVVGIGLAANSVVDATNKDILTQDIVVTAALPTNYTLVGVDPDSVFNVTNSSGQTVAASNYTLFLASDIIQIDNNATTVYGANTYTVTYQDDDIGISGSNIVLVGLITLLLVVGLVLSLVPGRNR